MITLINQAVGNAYPKDNQSGAIMAYAYDSPGGYLQILNQNVLMQLASGNRGQEKWTEDLPVPVGGVTFPPGVIGARFKNAVSGQIATVNGALAEKGDPWAALAATGSSGGATGMIAGAVNANGTIASGVGFTVAFNGVDTYTVTFTTPFASIPVVVWQATNGTTQFSLSAITTSQFVAKTQGATSAPWNFIATSPST